MKKVYIIIIMLFMLSSISFAESTEVKIGLSYNNPSIETVTIGSQNGFSFGISNEGYFVNLASFITDTVTFHKDTSYRIEVNEIFNTGSDAALLVELVKGMGYNAYSGYSNGFKVYVERSSDVNHLSSIMSTLSASITDYTFKIGEPNSNSVVVFAGSKPVFYYNSEDFNYILKDLNLGLLSYNGKTYRNGIGVKRYVDADFTVINYLSMNEYLYGVLPKEMSGDWPLEALKAQAVAARNYAYASMGKHGNHGYDLCNTVDCQVYGGASVEKPRSNQAVDETSNIILTFEGKLVSAYYHSNSGGYTANIEDVWTGMSPYLVTIYDPYSIDQPQYNWTLSYTPFEMDNLLKQGGYNIGTLKDIVIDDQKSSGRVTSITAIGSKGSETFEKEQFRAFLGYSTLRSMLFNLEKSNSFSVFNGQMESTISANDTYIISAEGVSKTNNTLYAYDGIINKDYKSSSDGYTFVGRGFGHGIGMSQWGAKAMAEQGFTYDQILMHYYKDTKLEVKK